MKRKKSKKEKEFDILHSLIENGYKITADNDFLNCTCFYAEKVSISTALKDGTAFIFRQLIAEDETLAGMNNRFEDFTKRLTCLLPQMKVVSFHGSFDWR